MELDLEWQEPGWRRVLEGIPRGTEIPVERFFAILGSVDEEEAREAALCLEERGVGLDVSHLPQSGSGALLQRLTLEAELVREGRLPGGLEGGDPLRLYWQELEQLPRLTETQARESLSRGENPNRLTEGLLWLVAQEAPAFAGQGVLLLDLMQEGAMGLMGAVEDAGENVLERARWHVRQAMARAVALQYMVSGEAQRLLASVRAYQQADRRLLERLGRNPGPEELAQELGMTVEEAQSLGKMVRDAAAALRREPKPEPEAEPEKVEDSDYFQLRSQVEELLSCLEPEDRKILVLRFGLNGKPPKSQEETASLMGLSLTELQGREQAAMALLRREGKSPL